jgi:hypothetical protein
VLAAFMVWRAGVTITATGDRTKVAADQRAGSLVHDACQVRAARHGIVVEHAAVGASADPAAEQQEELVVAALAPARPLGATCPGLQCRLTNDLSHPHDARSASRTGSDRLLVQDRPRPRPQYRAMITIIKIEMTKIVHPAEFMRRSDPPTPAAPRIGPSCGHRRFRPASIADPAAAAAVTTSARRGASS